MKRFALVALLAALIFSVASSASATEMKVKGQFDVYGLWSANLLDHDSDYADGDNFAVSQRLRTYFDFVASENLKAVLGLEIDNLWGQTDAKGANAGWGSDGTNIEVKHAYLDFNFPDTAVNVKAGLQYVALPSVFGHPIFDDDAAALVVSAPINDMIGVTVGYTRGFDGSSNFDDTARNDGVDKDDVDMAFLAVPVTLDGFSATPYFGYAWMGGGDATTAWIENTVDVQTDTDGDGVWGELGEFVAVPDGTFTPLAIPAGDDTTVWTLGVNAALTMFDPLTFAADLMYAKADTDDFETSGWYGALAATYKFDFMSATLLSTYATGANGDNEDESYMPVLREGWGLTAYVGGSRAFGDRDSWGTDPLSNTAVDLSSGVGLWTVGLVLDDISFVEKLSHTFVLAYGRGTSDEYQETGMLFTEEDSLWEVYLCNKFMIYENLAAINELGYLKASSELYEQIEGHDLDASYFATVGFQYKF